MPHPSWQLLRSAARRAPVLAAAAVAALTAGCNDDGRALAPAPPTTAIPATSEPAAGGLQLFSPDAADGALLDARFTCHGENVAPTLVISGVPSTAAELGVVMVDLDAGGRVHWAVTGLPPTVSQVGAGPLPEGAVAAATDAGVTGWEGPCPPAGDEPHRYEIRAYATSEPLGLAPDADGRQAIEALDAAAIDVARLMVRYGATAG